MKRMTNEKAEHLLAFSSKTIDLNNLPLNDKNTFDLFQKVDADEWFMISVFLGFSYYKLND